MITVNDKWFRLGFVALPSLWYLYFTLTAYKLTANHFFAVVIFFATIFIISEWNRLLIQKSRSFFKVPFRKFKRIASIIPIGILFTALVFIAGRGLRNYCLFGDWNMAGHTGASFYVNDVNLTVGIIGSSFFYAIILFLFLLSMYELFYHFARLKYSEKERYRLEKEKLVAELQQLKGIVNPHFLFNNLNSLSSLISESPVRAEAFLDELTKVFRYLLRNNNKELTTLAHELEFLHSYYSLLQTRHGEGIAMELTVDPDLEAFLLPPLTLQLLVENAVKHNRVHKDNPLVIEVFSKGYKLIVRNNLSKKETVVESTGMGLHSINTRYRIMNLEGLKIDKTEASFAVYIPLVEPHLKKHTSQSITITNTA